MYTYSLTNEEELMVLNPTTLLKDCHMDKFHSLLESHSNFKPKTTLYTIPFVHDPKSKRFEPLPHHLPHLQILHSCDNNCYQSKCLNGHWVCCYYNTEAIFIYDSLNQKRLHRSHEIYLKKLFNHFLHLPIYFPEVQCQDNAVDCGVFAIAFATSILFEKLPSTIIYDKL